MLNYESIENAASEFIKNRLNNLFNQKVSPTEQRFGGYLTIMDDTNGVLIAVLKIGFFSSEKADKYLFFSSEKAKRLFENKDHISSFQSRNPKQKKYSGAIRLQNNLIFSFSGLPEKADEGLCAFLAQELGFIHRSRLKQIKETSSNEFILLD